MTITAPEAAPTFAPTNEALLPTHRLGTALLAAGAALAITLGVAGGVELRNRIVVEEISGKVIPMPIRTQTTETTTPPPQRPKPAAEAER